MKKIYLWLVTIVLISALFIGWRFSVRKNYVARTNKQEAVNQQPGIISTNPNLTTHPTILPTQSLTITFNKPLENVGELKLHLEPTAVIDLKLSDDRKTATITPKQPFALGESYTIVIQGDTKFDGHLLLNHEERLNFKTIGYNGV